jgi:hypothetical protein
MIASMDLFVVPTLSFRLLYGLLILWHGRRQILWLGVTAHPSAERIARQPSKASIWVAMRSNKNRSCGRCHIVERRTREFCVANIFKRPRLRRATRS